MSIYNVLLDKLTLLPRDRELLKTKRGFSDAVIDKYQFKSCGPHVAQAISDLHQGYSEEALLEAKLLSRRRDGGMQVPQQLLDSNILIPYINRDGEVAKVRPHQRGLAGQPSMPYRTMSAHDCSTTLILAESEFKAVAAEMLGYPAVGIPGIASMVGVNRDEFLSLIKSIPASEVVVCFDNEIKDNPAFPNYKEKWKSRYDTIIMAYVMCKLIEGIGKESRIAILPERLMVDGKIDIDGALAAGMTDMDFSVVVSNAVSAEKYLRDSPIPDIHRWYVSRELQKIFCNSRIVVKDNCFHYRKADEESIKLGNFTITVAKTSLLDPHAEVYEDTPPIRRLLQLYDMHGNPSRKATMDHAIVSNKRTMSKWLSANGNFIFQGNDVQLLALWEHIFLEDMTDLVFRLPETGFLKRYGMWVYTNCIVKDGQLYLPGTDMIIRVDDSCYEVTPVVKTGLSPATLKLADGDFDIHRFRELISATVDILTPGMGTVMLSWALATLFCHIVVDKFKCFPLMFFYGEKGGGKTTILRWLLTILGTQDSIFSLKNSSQVGISRALATYHGLPIVVDDWRNGDLKLRQFIEFFLGVYNRQGGVKGTINPMGSIVSPINATMAILGEHLISDGGVVSRCAVFYMPPSELREKAGIDHTAEIEGMLERSGRFILHILENYEQYCKHFTHNLEQASRVLKVELGKRNVNSRSLINYTIIYAATLTFFGDCPDAIQYIAGKFSDLERSIAEDDIDRMETFCEELLSVDMRGQLPVSSYLIEGDFIHLAMRPICDAISKAYSRFTDESKLLHQYMATKPYYVKASMILVGNRKLPMITLDMSQMSEKLRSHFKALTGEFNVGGV